MDRRSLAVLTALLVHLLFLGIAQWSSQYALVRPQAEKTILIEMAPPSNLAKGSPKKLLLSKRDPQRSNSLPPQSARYFSDENRRVDLEQRARDGGIQNLSQLQSPSLAKSLSGDGPSRKDHPLSSNSQKIKDSSLREGAENFLNTAQSIHYSFYSRMYFSLAPIWQSLVRGSRPIRPLSPGDYTVVADLILDADGRLLGVEFREPSEISQFNEAVIASAKRVQKFPNPPRELINDNKEVRTLWSFTVNVGENSFFNILPPRRIQ